MKYSQIALITLVLGMAPLIGTCMGEYGTFENPIPLYRAAVLEDGWNITVQKIVSNRSISNALPKKDYQFFTATISAYYPGSGGPDFDGVSRLRAIGPTKEEYQGFSVRNEAKAHHGQYDVTWQINSSDANKLRMYDKRCQDEKGRKYFALYCNETDVYCTSMLKTMRL